MARTQVETPVSDRSALLCTIMRATFVVRTALLAILQQKAGFRPDQPRVPAGNPEGGQWVDEDGDADLILVNSDPSEFPDVPEKLPRRRRNETLGRGALPGFYLPQTALCRPRSFVAGFGCMLGQELRLIFARRNISTYCDVR